MVVVRRALGTPSPVEALPCGSTSRTSTFSPTAARAVARLMAVVVLPTPPFWLAMARTRGWGGRSDTGEPFHTDDATGGVAPAGDERRFERPGLAGLRQFGLDAASLQEEAAHV